MEAVLVKDLSRLGRHRTQTALFIDHLRENNVKVISVTEGNEIAELKQRIADNQKYDEVSRQKRDSLKGTSELLSEIISSGNISDANLRMLLNQVRVYNDEDGGIDVVLEFNGDYNY